MKQKGWAPPSGGGSCWAPHVFHSTLIIVLFEWSVSPDFSASSLALSLPRSLMVPEIVVVVDTTLRHLTPLPEVRSLPS